MSYRKHCTEWPETVLLTDVLAFLAGGPDDEGLSAGGDRGTMSGMSILWSHKNCITERGEKRPFFITFLNSCMLCIRLVALIDCFVHLFVPSFHLPWICRLCNSPSKSELNELLTIIISKPSSQKLPHGVPIMFVKICVQIITCSFSYRKQSRKQSDMG